jgi:hypothetical protein
MPKITTDSQHIGQSDQLKTPSRLVSRWGLFMRHALRLAFVVRRPPFVQQPFEVTEGGEHYDEANKVAVLP